MENKEKIKVVVFAIACFAAVSIFATSHYRRRRRNQKSYQTPCYLVTDDSKPQSTFKRVLADNSYTTFKHFKHDEDKSSNLHPYEEEITALLKNPQVEVFSFVDGKVDMEMSGSHIWVATKSQLEEVVKVLSNERVFAVDTEQHSLRSFLGFTALMQISTQNEDYLLDTIALHDVMGVLSPVFADPSICKVFHGADNDVLWLQRDFHIYVVNLFDTAKACEVLSKPHKSLAYLLETYCGVFTNKMLQREDWRLRPLSEEMVQYARADAHYLLYIADCLTTELKAQDTENSACLDDKFHFVLEARRRSNMVCLQLYTKEIEAFPGDSAASSILSRYLNGQGGVPSDSETKDLVGRLCMWRDFMARLHDESLRFVLSDQAIAVLASKVPKTLIEIYDIISEAESIMDPTFASSFLSPSPVVCSHLEDFRYLLQEKTGNLDDVFMTILQKHLGPDGACPLSIYNYAILSKCNLKPTNGLSAKQNGGKASRRIGRKASRQLFVQKFSCKSPVYHNCRIYASDGRLLCYCDRRKLEWYLRRDLAKLVDDNPPAIMLLFEPKGRPEDEDNDFYIQSKKNICVGCGERNHYLRYRIIPSCYRMHFPEHLKSHRSHDIVLLCVDCHEIAHSAAEKHKRQIAAEYGIPLFVKTVVDSRQKEVVSTTSGSVENHEQAGVSPLQLRTAAMALLRYGPMMPSKRREELTQIVMKYFGGREISQADLEKALLVGMSPHERRRLEKKRGISLRHCSEGIISNKSQESTTNSVGTPVLTEALKDNTKNCAQTPEEAECSLQEDRNLPKQMDTGAKDTSLCCDLGVSDETSANGSEDINFDKSSISEKENLCVSNTDEDFESRRPSDETGDPNYSYGTAAPNHNHKLSLLGHGPHGKQVVDHLLKEYGEDGIREFCQRWRQVFVEAVHPRFLPAGWDVKHSGRRDFGAYSVYNPTKKASDTVKA
ncbi:HRDC domain [Macleaya cordata]|uniref:HRDC domain n=1 Tax=Macleaya cordata TaxID=56857 RepID=A0A200QM43_MACCD|nr:HRDC domain [Macleaya cordata]